MTLLDRLSRVPLERPGATVGLALLLAGLAGLALARADLKTDVSEIIDTPAVRTLARADASFHLEEQAYVLAEDPTSPDAATAEARLVRFGRALRARLGAGAATAVIDSVSFALQRPADAAIDRLLLPWGPLYADAKWLEQRLSPAGMREQLEVQLARLSQQGLGQAERWVERDPLDLHRPIVARLERLASGRDVDPGSPWALSPDRRALLITVTCADAARTLSGARRVVAALEAARAATLSEPWAAGLTASGTGGPYLAEESERVIREDVTRGMSVSIVLALVLLAIGLRLRPWVVLALLLPTLWGALIGVGAVAGIRGSLAVLSLGCATTLIGLGLDFTIHVAAAARAERARGLGAAEAALTAVDQTRGALIGAALTSIAAFLAFQAAQLEFLVDMGRVIAGGLLACLLAALTLVPLLLSRALVGQGPDARPPRTFGVDRASALAVRRPAGVLVAAGLLTLAVGGLLLARPPRLETDLRRLHARDSAPLATQAELVERFGGAQDPLFLLLEAPDEPAVVAACQRLEAPLRGLEGGPDGEGGQPGDEAPLAGHASIAALLPPLATQRAALKVLRARGPAALRHDLRAALDAVGFDPASFSHVLDGLAEAARLERTLTAQDLRAIGLGPQVDRFVRPAQDGRPARALILLRPRRALLTRQARDDLLGRLRAALDAAGVSGVGIGGLPVVAAESAAVIASDFERISLLTLAAVLLVIALRFRNPRWALLALTPAALGTVWTAGLFSLLDIRLNMMNLAVLPMVLAIGIDDGIHMVHRHLHDPRDVASTCRATAVGVLLTSLTTMVAFGSLALSRNLGLSSVGLLTVAGVGSCLAASVLVLPALLTLLTPPAPEETP